MKIENPSNSLTRFLVMSIFALCTETFHGMTIDRRVSYPTNGYMPQSGRGSGRGRGSYNNYSGSAARGGSGRGGRGATRGGPPYSSGRGRGRGSYNGPLQNNGNRPQRSDNRTESVPQSN